MSVPIILDEMATLPPINKIALIGIWVASVLYGVNCVLYGLSVFVLLRRDKTAPLLRMLLAMSTILFLLTTVYVGTSLQQLLEAFVYAPANVPYYSTLYWVNLAATPRVLKGVVYGTLVLAQDVILIWRLYVVFLLNWRIIILPIILAAGCVGSAYAATAVSSHPGDGLYSSGLTSLVIAAWVCGFTLNASVTTLIVIRLWRLGQTLASPSTNRFASSIYMVIESGAISAVANAFVLALFASNSPAALFVLDIVAQVTVLTPLLIVVQVAVGRDRISIGGLSKMASNAPGAITFPSRVARDSGSGKEPLIDNTASTEPCWASSA